MIMICLNILYENQCDQNINVTLMINIKSFVHRICKNLRI